MGGGQIFTKHLECIKRSNVNIWQLHTHAQFTCKYVLLSFFLLQNGKLCRTVAR